MIAIVALLVLGPERLPKAARFAGLWVRRARAQWYSVKSELENELAADELKRSLQQTPGRAARGDSDLQRSGDGAARVRSGAAATCSPNARANAAADDAVARRSADDVDATAFDADDGRRRRVAATSRRGEPDEPLDHA